LSQFHWEIKYDWAGQEIANPISGHSQFRTKTELATPHCITKQESFAKSFAEEFVLLK